MSIFTVSDDGGTNQASSNVKGTVDFSGVTNYVDILADRLYVARDRTMIASNQSPNVQGDLTIGYGVVDANTVVLGYQEHSNKVDWTSAPYHAQPYLNYCEGRLVVTNGGVGNNLGSTFRVNGNMYLGYTADLNPAGSANQYSTYGRITLYSNATLIVSNIICDGGLNFYNAALRQNTITINQGGNLVVSNTVGYPNFGNDDISGFAAADPRGIYLDNLTISAGKLTLNVDPSRVNIYVRALATPGTTPRGVIKVAQLTGVTYGMPAQIPVIAYRGSASPFLVADVSALGAGYFAYVLNNIPNSTVDLYITTNSPNNLIWTGSINNVWDTSTANWVTAVGGLQTNFNLGDIVTFNDSSSQTSVTIPDSGGSEPDGRRCDHFQQFEPICLLRRYGCRHGAGRQAGYQYLGVWHRHRARAHQHHERHRECGRRFGHDHRVEQHGGHQ